MKSVGEYSPTVVSVGSANSVGGYARFAWLVHDCLVGALETSAPPERLLQAFYLFY